MDKLNLKVSRPNWAVKHEAQPVQLDYKDRRVLVYISEDGQLMVEFTGALKIETGDAPTTIITLESDL